MAPGPFSGLLAPFIGARKSKKYEKLQTEDPEKKRQEATQDEINRLHNKIVSFRYIFYIYHKFFIMLWEYVDCRCFVPVQIF